VSTCVCVHTIIHTNSATGVVLPGEKMAFPFLFKSEKPGIFSEQWKFVTSPILNEGRPVIVNLKGVAFQEDIYKDRRVVLEVSMY